MKRQAKLIGAGHALPDRVVTSEELEEKMEFDKFGIRKGMSKLLSGVSERRFAEDDENSSDYAVRAGKMALEKAGLKPEDIDLLLFCSITQDFMEPATSMKIQTEIGCVNANCFDIKNACNGLLSGIEVANMYIETGRADKILIVAGEILSRFVRTKYDDPNEINEANATFAVGDGGGALVFKAEEIEDDENILNIGFKTIGSYWSDGVLWGGGTMYSHDPEMCYFQNETREMMKTNFARAMEFYDKSMNAMGIDRKQIDLFVPHQITKFLTVKTCEMLNLPKEKTVDQVGFLGNNGCASIPIGISLALEEGKIELGKDQQIVLLGFGNGISMATVHMKI